MSADGHDGHDDGTPPLARRLKAARARLGVSIRELSRLAGIPTATISAIEGGREPRWSTLLRYLETVPGLRASDLIPGPHRHPPAASPSLTAYLRHALAQGAEQVTLTQRLVEGRLERTLHVAALATELVQVSHAETIKRLMQLVCTASREIVQKLQPPDDPGVSVVVHVEAENARHEFRLLAQDVASIDYRNTVTLPADAPPCTSIEHDSGHAIGRLILSAEIPPGQPVRLLAWLFSRRIEGSSAEIAAYLYPGASRPRLTRDGDMVSVSIPDVMPAIVHALDWSGDTQSAGHGVLLDEEDPPEAGFGSIARELRQRSGMSLRGLAEAMGVAHGTVAEAERDRDPRASTLRQYLHALPDVAPQWLLPAREARGVLTAEEAWNGLRDLHGIEAEALRRECTLFEDGHVDDITEFLRLRTVDGVARPIALGQLHGHNVHGSSSYRLVSMETDADEEEDDVTSRLVLKDHGRPHQVIQVPPAMAARGMWLRIHMTSGNVHVMNREGVHAKYGPTDELVVSGLALTPNVPARTAACTVRFPKGFRPIDVWPVALPYSRPFDHVPLGLLDHVHPGAHRWTSDPEAGLHQLEIDLPLYGLKYGIAWSI